MTSTNVFTLTLAMEPHPKNYEKYSLFLTLFSSDWLMGNGGGASKVLSLLSSSSARLGGLTGGGVPGMSAGPPRHLAPPTPHRANFNTVVVVKRT